MLAHQQMLHLKCIRLGFRTKKQKVSGHPWPAVSVCVLCSSCLPLGKAVTKRFFVALWQEEVNSGRADLISIMYFALFILQQLKEEVDTMMSGGLEQRWVGEQVHGHAQTRTHTHTIWQCTYSVSRFTSPAKQLSPISLILLLWRCLEKQKLLHTSVKLSCCKIILYIHPFLFGNFC